MRWANLLFCPDKEGEGNHGIVFSVSDKTKGYSPGLRIRRTNINATQRKREERSHRLWLFCYIIIIIVIKYPQLGETKEYYYYFNHAFPPSHSQSSKCERATCWQVGVSEACQEWVVHRVSVSVLGLDGAHGVVWI